MPRQSADTTPEPDIAEVVARVINEAGPLVKAAENKYAGYSYVPVDDYYFVLGKLAAKHGLVLVTREIEFKLTDIEGAPERRGSSRDKPSVRTFAAATYACDLHYQGHTWSDFSRATVLHPVTGPQTAGSAMSYAEKVFMRVVFKAVTGEEDGDAMETYRSVQHEPDRQDRRDRQDDRRDDRRDHADHGHGRGNGHQEAANDDHGHGREADDLDADERDESMEEENQRDSLLGAAEKYVRSFSVGMPVMHKETPADILADIFRRYVPEVTSVEVLRRWWEDNDPSLTTLHRKDPEQYSVVMSLFKARRDQLVEGKTK